MTNIHSDLFEQAVTMLDDYYLSQSLSADGFYNLKTSHRHPCCASCKTFGQLEKITENGKSKLRCKSCDHVSSYAVFRKPDGAKQTESRPHSRSKQPKAEFGDSYSPILSLSEPAYQWLVWCSESLKGFDSLLIKGWHNKICWNTIQVVLVLIDCKPNENPLLLSMNTQYLIERLADGKRSGRPKISNSELAQKIGEDRKQFEGLRKWGKIRSTIENVFDEWQIEIEQMVLDSLQCHKKSVYS